ncbi:MAG TPA: SAM-dependent methyltransferase [Gammaproteobacteria bacterium]|nr:SAM-dependent methyltransferase [Gammaproteobacteria bacterium]
MSSKEKWNARYRAAAGDLKASQVLNENLHLLPANGRALDLACGLGANAMLLAQQGLEVDAWDIADVAVAALQAAAFKRQLPVHAVVRDIEAQPPEPDTFAVIVVSHFLARDIIPSLIQALKPDGLIYYQTFTQQRVSDRGPQGAQYRLADQELLQLFSGLQVVFYREEGHIGDVQQGFRDEAMFIGKKLVGSTGEGHCES